MPVYHVLKTIHVSCAIVSIAGFGLRGIWMLVGSPMFDRSLVKTVPHIVDTIFLVSGVWMAYLLNIQLGQHHWLTAKLLALILYVLSGMFALRHGKTQSIRLLAFATGLLTYTYIVGVALTKSVLSWVSLTV